MNIVKLPLIGVRLVGAEGKLGKPSLMPDTLCHGASMCAAAILPAHTDGSPQHFHYMRSYIKRKSRQVNMTWYLLVYYCAWLCLVSDIATRNWTHKTYLEAFTKLKQFIEFSFHSYKSPNIGNTNLKRLPEGYYSKSSLLSLNQFSKTRKNYIVV
jgi:hypothetical protein